MFTRSWSRLWNNKAVVLGALPSDFAPLSAAVLMYWREYRTLETIGFSYGVRETTAWRIVRRVENALLACGQFTLPGKKALHSSQLKNALVLLGVTEVPVQRPQKKQARFYSGKKNRHTFKAQIVVEKSNGRITATAFTAGAVHDFALFKTSRLSFETSIELRADIGYSASH